jgi:hypothetical protein
MQSAFDHGFLDFYRCSRLLTGNQYASPVSEQRLQAALSAFSALRSYREKTGPAVTRRDDYE